MRKKKIEYWTVDDDTYIQLQKLIKFVEFVSNLEYTTDTGREKCNEIIELIKKLNNPESFKTWDICIDIYDRDIQWKLKDRTGVYWRSWSIFFEYTQLHIKAESYHSEFPFWYEGDFHYESLIYLEKSIDIRRVYMDVDLNEFLNDAYNFRNYITEHLNDVEVEINVY